MDMGSAAAAINLWAVLVSSTVTFVIGGLWYSPVLFARIWMAENGFREEDLKGANMAKIFGVAFVLQLIAAFMLAMFIGPQATAGFSTLAGLMVGLGWVATSFGVVYLFERRSIKLWLINAGYLTISFTVMGVILGLWR
jgi:hypothetical protein